MGFVTFVCKGCGAGVGVQPDSLLTLCESCGTLYPSKNLGDVPVHIVPSVNENKIRSAVNRRMASDRQMKGIRIRIKKLQGQYVPLYIQRVTAEGSWSGYRYEKQGDNRVKVRKNGSFSRDTDYPIFARQHAHEFGMAELGLVLEKSDPISFSEIDWQSTKLPVLAVDIDDYHADQLVRDDIIDQQGMDIKSRHRLKAIDEFDANVTIHDRSILMLPLWTVIYEYRRGNYRVAVYGGENPVVLSAMEPVFMARRVWHLMIGLAAIVGVGVVGYLGVLGLMFVDSDSAEGVIGACGAGILFCMWLAWRTARSMTASINIESMGPGKDVLT